ncbi:hypothetical protein GM1_030_00700 [Gordonia malaquae NBRC 108250]|uniref:Uncharacterized protein n=2 Tax=Gordonia malaquae TaxID=410332 RepID=M3TIC2_GORML|nr:hypothetical protein GM1_030_00700 [Gordonia malaquae NBRC 108250]
MANSTMTAVTNPRACQAHQRTTHDGHHIRVWCAKNNGHNGAHETCAGVTFTDHQHDGGRGR